MAKKLIHLHEEWKKTGTLPECGLCYSLPEKYKKTFDWFVPTHEYDQWFGWAADDYVYGNKRSDDCNTYGNTRQMIVLFICAIHGEI